MSEQGLHPVLHPCDVVCRERELLGERLLLWAETISVVMVSVVVVSVVVMRRGVERQVLCS